MALANLPNLVFSPHRSGHCADIEQRRRAALASVLVDLAACRDLSAHQVDVERGY